MICRWWHLTHVICRLCQTDRYNSVRRRNCLKAARAFIAKFFASICFYSGTETMGYQPESKSISFLNRKKNLFFPDITFMSIKGDFLIIVETITN
jgi:hypothetical protein